MIEPHSIKKKLNKTKKKGAELSKSTNALKLTQSDYKEEDFCPTDKLISAFPNNGTLRPFEKRPIFFRFFPQ